jgi:hypothetical protein
VNDVQSVQAAQVEQEIAVICCRSFHSF